MAIVGEAHIIVRAITNKVNDDIRRGFNGSGGAGRKAGEDMGRNFIQGFRNSGSNNIFGQLQSAMRGANGEAEGMAQAFHSAMRAGFAYQAGIGSLIGGISSLIGALGALAGSAGGAAASLVVIGNGAFAAISALGVLKSALGGIGKAIGAYNKQQTAGGAAAASNAAAQAAAAQRIQQAEQALARTIETNREQLISANNQVRDSQLALNLALKAGQEELQQLGFDAEDAALAEKRAGMDLQDARDKLAAAQDLPPNSRARQDAELGYQEAELAYRRAKDRNSDLAKQEADAAEKGVAGTQTVIDASKNLQDAEANRAKTARDGARQEQAAVQALADARKAAAAAAAKPAGGSGAADPFAALTASQKKFAMYLISLQPRLKALKVAASDALLPPLQQAIEKLMAPGGLFDTIVAGVPIIGRALGAAANSIADAFSNPRVLGNITTLFVSSGKLIENFGKSAGHYITAFSTILAAAAPLAERFSDFLLQSATNFDNFIAKADSNGSLTKFFKTAGDTMASFGTIFGNLLSGLGAMIRANMGPGTGGQMLLDFFIKGSSGLRDLNTATGQSHLKKYFQDVAKNAMPILSFVKQIVKAFLGLGGDPAIAKTFTTLQGAVPSLASIAKAGIDAGPAFANVVVHLAKIIAILADTGAPTAFFQALDGIIKPILDFVSRPAVNKFLNDSGKMLATISAFTFTAIIAAKGFSIFFGSISLVFGVLSRIVTPFVALARVSGILFAGLSRGSGIIVILRSLATFGGKFGAVLAKVIPLVIRLGGPVFGLLRTGLGLAITGIRLLGAALLANPIGIIITLIGLLVAGLIWFFTQTDVGRKAWAEFTRFLGEAWTNIVATIQVGIDNLVNFFQAAWIVIQTAVAVFIAIVQGYFTILIGFWTGVWQILTSVVQAAWGLVVGLIQTAVGFIVGYVEAYITLLLTIWTSIWNGLVTTITGVWNAIITFIRSAITNVQTIINNVLGLIVAIFTGHWDQIPKYLRGIWNGVVGLVRSGLNLVRSVISSVLSGVRTVWNGIWGGIGNFFHSIWANIVSAVRGAARIFGDAFGKVATGVRTAFGTVLGAIRTAINGVIDVMNNGIGQLNKLHFKTPGWLPKPFGGLNVGLNIPKIPRLALGGVVMPSNGGSIVNVAEAGRPERIEPLDAQGLSVRDRAIIAAMTSDRPAGVTLNLYPPPGANNREIADMVNREIAFQMRKGGY